MNKLLLTFLGITLIFGLYSLYQKTCVSGFLCNESSFGAISYPTSLDTLTNPSPTDSTATVSHSAQHSNANDAIEALQAKVGVNGSAVNTTIDFKLSGVADGDYACSLTGTETLTNKTLTSPVVNSPSITSPNSTTTTLWGTTTIAVAGENFSLDLGSDATGDIYYRNSQGYLQRLGIGSNNQFLQVSSGVPTWQTQSPTSPSVTYASSTQSFILPNNATVYITGRIVAAGSGGSKSTVLRLNGSALDTITFNPNDATQQTPVTFSYATTTGSNAYSVAIFDNGATQTAKWTMLEF